MTGESRNPTSAAQATTLDTTLLAEQPISPGRFAETMGGPAGNGGPTTKSGEETIGRAPSPRCPDPLGPPLVAVCGLAGSVGTSTLTVMLGYAAATQGRGHVLVADTGGAGASLAGIAKKRSEHSLVSAARARRLGVLKGKGMFTEISPRLRLIGREPNLAGDDLGDLDPELADLLADAQEAHLAVFVDCGRLEKDAQIAVARSATHIVWVTSGNATGARKARVVLESTNLAGSQTDFLIVRSHYEGLNLNAERELRLAAEEADALLVFCPDAGDVVEQGIDTTATRVAHELRITLGRIL